MSVSSVHFVSQDPLHSSAGAMSPIHVLASTKMDPLQDPHLRIHVSASLYLRLLCKIHVCGSMAHHPYVSQDPLQDPCLRIHVSASICISGSSARAMSPDPCLRFMSQHPLIRIRRMIHVSVFMSRHFWIHVSASLYLRLLCKIHVSGSMAHHPYVSQGPLQDPCLRIHVSASICISGSSARSTSPISQGYLQHPCLRIHVSASICISGSSARSMSPDPCLRFMSQHPLLQIRRMIHVSVFMSRRPYVWILSKIRISAFISVDPVQNRHGATAKPTRRAPIPHRVACIQSKSTRRYNESDSTHRHTRTNSAEGCASADPTRRKYWEGCADEIKIGTALQRERSDTREVRRGLRDPEKMRHTERQPHSCVKMSTATQRGRCDARKLRRGLRFQTWNRHRAAARLKKSEFQPHLDVSFPIRNTIFRCFVAQVYACHEKMIYPA